MGSDRQANALVGMVLNSESELILDQHQNACIAIDGGFTVYQIKSKFVKKYLFKIFWEKFNSVIKSGVIGTVINTLEGIAFSSDENIHIYNRIARIDDEIFYDIGDNLNIIRITKKGWFVEQGSPVYFRRLTHQKVQVIPESKGKLSDLDKFINVRDKAQDLLLKTYLPTAFFEDISRPVLLIHGPQGSGKSTTLRRIRELIDPSSIPLLTPQYNEEDLNRQADHNYCFFIDNVSSLHWKISDSICRFVTGSAFSKRALYTNDDDVLYSFKRLVGMNGIDQVATRADLLDRSLIIELERISKSERKRDSELDKNFKLQKPKIFGALLNAVSAVLASKDNIKIKELPRLADYYQCAVTASEYFGCKAEDFKKIFQSNIEKQHETSLESSSVAQCVLVFMSDKKSWKKSPSELYDELNQLAIKLSLTKGFPKGANWLWKSIARVEETLRAYKIEIYRDKEAGVRIIGLDNLAFGKKDSIDSTTENHIRGIKKYADEKNVESIKTKFID